MSRTIYTAMFAPSGNEDRRGYATEALVRLIVFDCSDPGYRTVHNICEMPYAPSVGRHLFRGQLEPIWEDCSFDWLQLGAARWRIGSKTKPEAVAEAIVQHVMEIRL